MTFEKLKNINISLRLDTLSLFPSLNSVFTVAIKLLCYTIILIHFEYVLLLSYLRAYRIIMIRLFDFVTRFNGNVKETDVINMLHDEKCSPQHNFLIYQSRVK